MKMLKIFGLVVGIHVFALILIFANPGCSSTNKPTAAPSDTISQAEPAPAPAAAGAANEVPPTIVTANESPVTAAPMTGDSATMASSPVAVRFSPTRPGTAAATALESQPVGDVTPATTYTVGRGDSLWSIAKKNHITVAELAAANNLKQSSMVKIGQKLIVPGKAMAPDAGKSIDTSPAKPAAVAGAGVAPKASGESVKHTVKPGETLEGIARKYQVKYGDIAVANNISDPGKIRPGMVLTIPGWRAPAAKSESAAKSPEVTAPPPGQDLDAGVNSTGNEAPVIQVEEGSPGPGKP